jgi:hypothetical protein
MPLDPSLAGKQYPSDRRTRSREKIREFADAIGAPDAAIRDPEAAKALGHPDVIAPPTFPVVFTAAIETLVGDAELGLDFAAWSTATRSSATTGRCGRGSTRGAQLHRRDHVRGRQRLHHRPLRDFHGRGRARVTISCRLVVRGEDS